MNRIAPPPEADRSPLRNRSFAGHLTASARLAAPIAVARAAILVMFVADTVMTGWAGAAELAALGLGAAIMVAVMLIAIGVLQTVIVLVARALGRSETDGLGAIWRAGLLTGLLLGLATIALARFAEPFFLATGQTGALSAHAADVSQVFSYGIPGMLLFVATNLFLEATGSPRVGMWIMIAANIVNIALNSVLIFGLADIVPAMGAIGAMIASSLVRWLAFFGVLAILLRRELQRSDRWNLFALGGEGPLLSRFVTIGTPMGLAQGVESTAFAALAVIAGLVSAETLAVHQALISLLAFVYMFSIGIAGATAIRVGRAAGAGDRSGATLAGWSGLILSALWTAGFTLLFLLAPRGIAGVYGFEGATLGLGAATVLVAAFVLPFDGMMAAALGALRGLADVWVPLGFQTVAFWGLTVPLAWALAPSWKAPGLMAAILAGVLASVILLAGRFFWVTRVRRVPDAAL